MARKRKSTSLAIKSAELALAAPQVVAHRVARMAQAGATPSARDRKEFERMVNEKSAAFGESAQAMLLASIRANQAFALGMMRAAWGMPMSMTAISTQVQNAALDVLSKGIAPVHRTATANAKRLGRKTRGQP